MEKAIKQTAAMYLRALRRTLAMCRVQFQNPQSQEAISDALDHVLCIGTCIRDIGEPPVELLDDGPTDPDPAVEAARRDLHGRDSELRIILDHDVV